MPYEVNQLVEHPALGLGKVLSVDGDKVDVFFKNDAKIRRMATRNFPLKVSDLNRDPLLDNLNTEAVVKAGVTGNYWNQQAAIDHFLKIFPEGFNDPKYLGDSEKGERAYKVKAHEQWHETLNKEEFHRLLTEREFAEIVRRASKIEENVDLVFRLERAALWHAVSNSDSAQAYSLSLFELIYGDDIFEIRFNRHASLLGELPRDQLSPQKWPVQTLFPFLAWPQEHLLLQPQASQKAAERRAFNLSYEPLPNWRTYSRLLQFGELLKQELADLGPRDMIDIQSFIYVTGDEKYPLS